MKCWSCWLFCLMVSLVWFELCVVLLLVVWCVVEQLIVMYFMVFVYVFSVDVVLCLVELGEVLVVVLFVCFDLWFECVVDGELIFGSFWGDEEVGIIGIIVYVCGDMLVYLLLYEVCYLIVLLLECCVVVYIDVIDLIEEEDVICYLQIVLVDVFLGVGCDWLMVDMDVWGYLFWFGLICVWFEQDVENVCQFLFDWQFLVEFRV